MGALNVLQRKGMKYWWIFLEHGLALLERRECCVVTLSRQLAGEAMTVGWPLWAQPAQGAVDS